MDKLKKALLRGKTGGVEENVFEVISGALDVPVAILQRIFYAQESLSRVSSEWDDERHLYTDYDCLRDPELRKAIDLAMKNGYRRMKVGNAIKSGQTISIPISLLVCDAGKVCDGCPQRISCLAESLYKPDDCFKDRRVQVYPLKISGENVELESTHPPGKFTIPLRSIKP